MENQEKKTSFTIGLYWKILLILLLSIIAHFAVLNAPFIYDDEPALLFNADVQVLVLLIIIFSILMFFYVDWLCI